MATNHSSQTPPPPYNSNQHRLDPVELEYDCDQQHFVNLQMRETIPKSSPIDDRSSRLTSMSTIISDKPTGVKHPHNNQVDRLSDQHTCSPVATATANQSRKLPMSASTAAAIARQQSSPSHNFPLTSAPKKFFNYVTIEPLAFLAILALYIEFPSIQDLIYTKICLQVVAGHPNLTSIYRLRAMSSANIAQSLSDTTLRPNIIDFSISPLSATNFTQIVLPTYGRIKPANSSANDLQQVNPATNALPTEYLGDNDSYDHLLCDRLNKTAIPKDIRQKIADGDSLFWFKYQVIICLLCTLSSPYWGGMSDRIGRLIPLNVPIVMSVLSNLISLIFGLLISMNSHTLFRVEWLYLGAVMVGISGGQAVVIINSFSFISDNSSSESRSKRVAVLESVIYLSHSFGFYITKYIMSLGLASPTHPWFNRHFVAFTSCILLNLICVLYSIIKLRHHKFHRFLNNFEREQREASDFSSAGGNFSRINTTVSSNGCDAGMSSTDRLRELTSSTPDDLDGPIVRADRSWNSWNTLLTFKYYKETYETTTKPRESRSMILLLLLCGFISAMCLTSLMSLLYIYLHMDPFNWTTSQYSSWNSITSITRGMALVGLTICMKFVASWNVPDPLVAAIGFLSKGAGLLMIALAQSSSVINWSLLVFIPSEFSMPPIRSLLSKLVVREEVGKIYSCLGAIQSICFLIGNIIFYLAYTSLELQNFFGLSFLIVGCFQFVAVFIMLIIYTTLRRKMLII